MDTRLQIESARGYIEKALAYAGGSHTFEDVRDLVAQGKMQFWPAPHSVIITEVIEYPRLKVLNLFLAGGNLVELERMTPVVLEWGKEQGCDRAAFLGRAGWERTFLTRSNWKKVPMVVLETSLIDATKATKD